MVSSYLRSTFKFRKTTVSLLFALTVLALALTTIIDANRYKSSLPSDKYSKKLLDTAWHDLEVITEKPHPYTSHFNDEVHDYLLKRVRETTKGNPHVKVWDDYKNRVTKLFKHLDIFNDSSTDTRLVYYESSNVLVKVQGKNPDLPGLLLSAHFDSVPTAYGATDDGKGVVSLLTLLQYYSDHQPERTIVFNFNNNEEFGLLGATIFTYHPWFKIVSYVINLEGTGTGSKAVLFRTSDTGTASVYGNSVKNLPYGNSMYQQGFFSRFVSSETDYKIYELNGLRGWDIAFYKPRDLYHTGKDTVLYTSKDALWHMLSTAWQLSKYIASDDANTSQDILDDEGKQTPAVYFDVLTNYFFVVSAKQLYFWNIVLLLIAPITLLLLRFVCSKLQVWNMPESSLFTRLPVSVTLSGLTVLFSKKLLSQLNSAIWSRNFIIPLLFFVSEFIVINAIVLNFFEHLWPLQDFKTLSLLEITALLWLVLIKITWDLDNSDFKNTGVYPFTIVYALVSLGAMFGLLSMCFNTKAFDDNDDQNESEPEQVNRPLLSADSDSQAQSLEEPSNIEATENSPLIRTPLSSGQPTPTASIRKVPGAVHYLRSTLNYDWSIQYLLVVPFSVFILWQSLYLLLDALAMTVQESNKAVQSVFTFATYGAIVVSVPLLPFVAKLNRYIVLILTFTILITASYSILMDPFTETSPLKLRFVQRLDLSSSSGVSQKVEVYGRSGANLANALESLPSRPTVQCEAIDPKMEKCSYEGIWPNFGIPMKVDVLKNTRNDKEHLEYEPYFANVRISVKDNRNCAVRFNSTAVKLLKQVEFKIGNNTESYSYKSDEGIDSLLLHKLDFSAPYYDLQLKWIPRYADEENVDTLGVSIDCYWGEFDEMVKDGQVLEKVPAYSEALQYLPKNMILSNRESGIVTIHKYLEL